mmetsp:Transcript_38029/g.79934  ORF Transcript_38029/g.79934 Transcript_38029/m.79934 type:complete len:299 (+) Transcript_38029:66-962(+)|eukprot:4272303-Pleurochrysis_carterae.AAC.5
MMTSPVSSKRATVSICSAIALASAPAAAAQAAAALPPADAAAAPSASTLAAPAAITAPMLLPTGFVPASWSAVRDSAAVYTRLAPLPSLLQHPLSSNAVLAVPYCEPTAREQEGCSKDVKGARASVLASSFLDCESHSDACPRSKWGFVCLALSTLFAAAMDGPAASNCLARACAYSQQSVNACACCCTRQPGGPPERFHNVAARDHGASSKSSWISAVASIKPGLEAGTPATAKAIPRPSISGSWSLPFIFRKNKKKIGSDKGQEKQMGKGQSEEGTCQCRVMQEEQAVCTLDRRFL